MSRWYQNVLTGERREVTTLEEDDFYVDNASNWSRVPAPPEAEQPVKKPEAAAKKAAPRRKA